MITTPEKNLKQKKQVYRSSIPKEEKLSDEREEGEIIDEYEQEEVTANDKENIDHDEEEEMKVNESENIEVCSDEEQIVISDDNYDITNDVTIPQELNIITEEDVLDTLTGNNSPAIHYSNIDDVLEVLDSDENTKNEHPTDIQEDGGLNSSLEKEIDNVMTELDIMKKNDDEICDVLIDTTDFNVSHEEEVAGTVSAGTDNLSSESEEEHKKKVNVITVQPIAYYDELFPCASATSETVTQAQTSNEPDQKSISMGIKTEMNDITGRITSENVPVGKSEYKIKEETKDDDEETDDDVIIIDEEHEEVVHKRIKYTPRKNTEPSAKRTLDLKKLIQSSKVKAPPKNILKKPSNQTIKKENPMYAEPSSSKIHAEHAYSRTRDETVRSIMPANPQPELSVHIPSCGSQSMSRMVMLYKKRNCMKKETLDLEQIVDKSSLEKPVPEEKQVPGFYYCDKCDKSFKDKGYYWEHMTRLCKALPHLKVIKCSQCDKCFKHQKSLRQHLQVHDGVKRYKCKNCQQMFLMESNLKKHRLICGK